MRDAIAWSYDLLESGPAALFRRLGVFIGGFDVESAAAVSDGDATGAALEMLLHHNLVWQVDRRNGPTRFVMLETIREFALEQLVASGEHGEIAKRHAVYFTALSGSVDMWWEPFALEWGHRLEVDVANSRAALDWLETNDPVGHVSLAAAMSAFWYYIGRLAEGQQRLERALEIAGSLGDVAPASDVGAILLGLALVYQMQGDATQAIVLLQRCLDVSERAGHIVHRTGARSLLGGAFVSGGQYEEARPLFEAALAQWRLLGNQPMVGVSLFHLGLIAFVAGDLGQAHALIAEAVEQEDAAGAEIEAVDPMHYLALIACEKGDLARAASVIAKVLERLVQRGSGPALADGFADVATLAFSRRQFAAAARYFGVASTLLDAGGGTYPLPARNVYERAADESRRALGDELWSKEFENGRRLPVTRALSEAEAMLSAAAGNVAGSEIGILADSLEEGRLVQLGVDANHLRADFDLTRREHEVLALVCQRLTDPEIAARLFISPRTASSHVSNVLGKLGAANRREAAGIAARERLV